MDSAFQSLFVTMLVAVVAIVGAELLPRAVRVPQVVLCIVGGIVVGPQVLGWASSDPIDLLSTMGMGFLFLLAGYELDLGLFRERPGRVAIRSWVVSLACAAAAMALAWWAGIVDSPVVLAIALTTTALGTLIPILKEHGMLAGTFGRYAFAMGAVGELGPVLAMALFLGAQGTVKAAVSLAIFLALVAFAVLVPRRLRPGRVTNVLLAKTEATGQSTLRLVVALLALFLLASQNMGFDTVLGAFAAGIILRAWTPAASGAGASGAAAAGAPDTVEDKLAAKLEAVGYGVFIPIFFVCSGLNLDVASIVTNPLPLVIFAAALLAVRGLPALAWYRRDLPRWQRWQMVFLSATALPLLVALTELGVERGHMTGAEQASIIGAGVLSVMIFPLVAITIGRRRTEPAT